MGSGSSDNFLVVLLRDIDVLAWPFVSLLYPLYASVLALQSQSPADVRQWLVYWVLHTIITSLELIFAKVFEWIPLWSYIKLVFICWLVIPYFGGAAYVYDNHLRPLFMNPEIGQFWNDLMRNHNYFSKPSSSVAVQHNQYHGTTVDDVITLAGR